MWYIKLWKIIKWIFRSIPLEQLLAIALNEMIRSVDKGEGTEKANVTLDHCLESVTVLANAYGLIEDKNISQKDLLELNRLRKELIALWADGGVNTLLESRIEELEAK